MHKLDSFKVNVESFSKDHRAQVEEDLKSKIDSLNVELDYGRLEQELFYYLEKIDINEEIVRLNSHLKFFSDVLNNNEVEKGKKLGFICQEIGREINTIGSHKIKIIMLHEFRNQCRKRRYSWLSFR